MTAVAQDARGQARNRELALERLRDRLAAALRGRGRAGRRGRPPPRAGGASSQKRRASERKRARRRPVPRTDDSARSELSREARRAPRRSALAWAVVFLVLAFAGGGGTDRCPTPETGAASNQAGTAMLSPGALLRGRVSGWSTATP